MKYSRLNLTKMQQGSINLTPEDSDDIWLLSNLINQGDQVECITYRKVQLSDSDKSATQRLKMVLCVVVEKLDVDLEGGSLRINGKNIKENEWVGMGSYHTLQVEIGMMAKIYKDKWDQLDIELVKQASDEMRNCKVGAIVLQEGLAHLCILLNDLNVKVLEKVEGKLPKKKLGSTSKSDAATEKFYTNLSQRIFALFDLQKLKALIITSPGNFKEELYTKLLKDFPSLPKNKILKITSSSGQITSLQESLKDPKIVNLLSDTKNFQDNKLMDVFHKNLEKSSSDTHLLSVFGYSEVFKVVKQGAVKDLMISDNIFR